nr:hypothetical protein [uncultured Dongia sp.]
MSGILDRLLSRRQAATVPSMDGVLRPNEALDHAHVLASAPASDNLAKLGTMLVFSSGADVLGLPAASRGGPGALLHHLEGEITALAAWDSALAIAIDDIGLRFIGGPYDGLTLATFDGRPVRCITAMVFADADTVFACIGSAQNGPGNWQRDLMEMRASGSIWRIDLRSKAAICVADRLAYPNGILIEGDALIVSESWSHRLLRVTATGGRGRPEVILEDLPGYPGRLMRAASGGAWLAVFAPRSQLIEFVLRERAYCTRMMREVPQSLWIAPTLRAGVSFKEPMQGGAVKVHGIFKPWAPTRSYGLAMELDASFAPVRSFHSRADGDRHGIVSVCEWGNEVAFASRGNGVICALPVPQSNLQERAK